ncbi:uncharacterized protein C19orf47 homolog isoform X1 [Schistocerca serialis cubense]|uniref:uncharacterized protein C19orf47 homolog isoform X1 n=1 Tax=Schistocerca serialis cubense TaxID=2023355 RepID=UPI00214E0617|nr:uncharacterized protein C19orf47 homolog isoform X1 [Schistocerca serialis cubense]
MAERGTEGWVKFFREAGIPAAIAADYAITFNDNRIQRNMLLDLNREILKEMGITLIGDVIAILRHAKTVHDKRARERILAAQSSPQKTASRGQKDGTETSVKARKHNASKESGKQPLSLAAQNEVVTVAPKKRIAPVQSEIAVRQNEEEDTSMEVDDEIKVITPVQPPTKKARMVLPEHEGGYRITMPAGTTPRSRAILSMVAARQSNKHRGTVFDRLGECVVSSTTGGGTPPEEPAGAGTTVITVTGVTPSPNKVGNSVFSRLGGKKAVASPVANSATPVRAMRSSGPVSGQLQYAGILKKNSNSPSRKGTIVIKQKKTGTMRADEETGTAKERLGLKEDGQKGSTPIEPAVVRKILSTTGKMSAGILSNPENATTRSVKTRLGVTITSRQPLKQAGFRPRITGPSSESGTPVMKIVPGIRNSFGRSFVSRGGSQWRGGRFSSRLAGRPSFRR